MSSEVGLILDLKSLIPDWPYDETFIPAEEFFERARYSGDRFAFRGFSGVLHAILDRVATNQGSGDREIVAMKLIRLFVNEVCPVCEVQASCSKIHKLSNVLGEVIPEVVLTSVQKEKGLCTR